MVRPRRSEMAMTKSADSINVSGVPMAALMGATHDEAKGRLQERNRTSSSLSADFTSSSSWCSSMSALIFFCALSPKPRPDFVST